MSKRKSKWEVVQCRLNRDTVYKINADWEIGQQGRERNLFGSLGSLFADIPAPASQGLDDFGRYGGCEWDSKKDEALVDCVCYCELRPYTCTNN